MAIVLLIYISFEHIHLYLKFERENFYPGLGIEPWPLALCASALPLCHPGQLPIQGRINLFEPILSDLRTTNSAVVTSYAFE